MKTISRKKLLKLLIVVLLISVFLGVCWGLLSWVVWGATTTVDRIAVVISVMGIIVYSTLILPFLDDLFPKALKQPNRKKSPNAAKGDTATQEGDHA